MDTALFVINKLNPYRIDEQGKRAKVKGEKPATSRIRVQDQTNKDSTPTTGRRTVRTTALSQSRFVMNLATLGLYL